MARDLLVGAGPLPGFRRLGARPCQNHEDVDAERWMTRSSQSVRRFSSIMKRKAPAMATQVAHEIGKPTILIPTDRQKISKPWSRYADSVGAERHPAIITRLSHIRRDPRHVHQLLDIEAVSK